MDSYIIQSPREISIADFQDYLLSVPFNKKAILMLLAASAILWCIFKYIYPYAGFINGDSYTYIAAAHQNPDVAMYPMGYPLFLRLVSVLSIMDITLVTIQYMLLQSAVMLLLFTLFYFYEPSRWVKYVLIVAIGLNPVSLYLSNYVSSDSIFLSLSLLWVTLMIWIMHYQSFWLILLHAVVILLAFSVRYNALWYPFVSLLPFLFSPMGMLKKMMGIALTFLLVGLFISHARNSYKKISGTAQFSPFSGWQLANNAMYAYRYVDSADRKDLPKKFFALDRTVRDYFDSTRDPRRHPQEMLVASTVYMWSRFAPLRLYMDKRFKKDSRSEFKRWATIAPLYSAYGKELIRTYPGPFLEHYLLPNFLKYYVPPVEFLETYSTGVGSVPPIARQWFGYSSSKLKHRTKDMKVQLFSLYPIAIAMLNALFVLMGVFILSERLGWRNRFMQFWLLLAAIWLANLFFSVFASPIALRFQLFPSLCCFVTDVIAIDLIRRKEAAKRPGISAKTLVTIE